MTKLFRYGDRLVKVVDGRPLIAGPRTAHRSLAKAPKWVRRDLKERGWADSAADATGDQPPEEDTNT